MEKENTFRPLVLLFGIITLFVFAISFSIFYTTENFSSVCGCRLPLWVILVSISSLGLFVGLITYYILSNHFIKEKKKIEKNIMKFLDLLESEDKEILKNLIEKKGEINQSTLSRNLGFNKVKMSRAISKLENKEIIRKEKSGMTNRIILNEKLKRIFVE